MMLLNQKIHIHKHRLTKLQNLLLKKISPEVGLSISESRFNKVDLPEPDGPTNE